MSLQKTLEQTQVTVQYYLQKKKSNKRFILVTMIATENKHMILAIDKSIKV